MEYQTKFSLHPYDLAVEDGFIVIRKRFIHPKPQEVVITRSQAEVFIEHFRQFIDRIDAEKRRAVVENAIFQATKNKAEAKQ